MTDYHDPMPVPKNYSPEQLIAILDLLQTLHDHLHEVYELQLQALELAKLVQLAAEENERQYDIPF